MPYEMMDVTSMNRPDPSWRFVDAAGHEHYWYVRGENQPAVGYSPSKSYHVPSTVEVADPPIWLGDEIDGEEYTPSHLECAQCGERVEPRLTADTCKQYVRGLYYYED